MLLPEHRIGVRPFRRKGRRSGETSVAELFGDEQARDYGRYVLCGHIGEGRGA